VKVYGSWHQRIEDEERAPAHALVNYLFNRFTPTSVCDFGCSTGIYLEPWSDLVEIRGLENDPEALKAPLVKKVERWDLRENLPFAYKADLGLCLEVLEHVHENDAAKVIGTVCRATSEWIIFSAALPGQGTGIGGSPHVNCQPKPYWIDAFESYRWIVDYPETVAMLDAIRRGPHMGRFTQNAMVLRPYRGAW
jgi:SAM-dependent methyltransferase